MPWKRFWIMLFALFLSACGRYYVCKERSYCTGYISGQPINTQFSDTREARSEGSLCAQEKCDICSDQTTFCEIPEARGKCNIYSDKTPVYLLPKARSNCDLCPDWAPVYVVPNPVVVSPPLPVVYPCPGWDVCSSCAPIHLYEPLPFDASVYSP